MRSTKGFCTTLRHVAFTDSESRIGDAMRIQRTHRVVDGENLAGWSTIARSPNGRIDVMFGPVITAEAHFAFQVPETHSNNTAEMTAMIEALVLFRAALAQLPVMRIRVFIVTPSMLLVCAWARSKPARMFTWHLRASGPCYAPNTGYGSTCNTCTSVTPGIATPATSEN